MKTETRKGMGIYNDDTTSKYTYDTADKLTQTITTTKGVSVTNNYTHDTAGNITSDGIYTYSYDVGKRVILKQGNGERIRYNYDSDGNLVEEISNTGVKTYNYNSQNKLVNGTAENGDISAYIYNGLGVRVITEQLQDNVNAVYQNAVFHNGSRFMTDYMPVLIDTRNVWQRSYETEVGTVVQNDPEFIRKEYITDYTSIANRDIMVYEEGSYIQRYVYGLNGERTSAEFSYYDETERTGNLTNPGENPASDFASEDIQKIYYFRNLLDSTMLAMDRNGDVISHVMYDEWGTPLTEPRLDHNFAGIKNINNYTGYTYDYILDIYFAQNRFYNPDTRQFIQQDPIKDGMNFYGYCDGNPMTRVDWLGLTWTKAQSDFLKLGTNAESFQNIQKLLDLADEYTPSASNEDKADLVLHVMRMSIYNGSEWDQVAGSINQKFVSYVRSQDVSLITYFKPEVIIVDKYKNQIELNHLAATLNAYMYKSSFKGFKPTVAGEMHINHLSGWAGDLQTFMVDIYRATNGSGDYSTVATTAMSMFGCDTTRFSYADFYADVDAANISKLVNKNTTLMDALYAYYADGYKSRFKVFINNYSKNEIRAIVGMYTDKSMHVPSVFGWNDWPLTKGYNFSDDFRDAMRDAFTDILWEHVLAEEERNK